ncbi:MAG: hypothetical protein MJY60_05745 [Bacteroidales bacterium]|nr:hypothetical protein [Bacteroidales bacterium]
MKRFFLIVFSAALCCCACGQRGGASASATASAEEQMQPKDSIRKGDLLFVGIPGDYYLSDTLFEAGQIPVTYIHASMLDVDEDGLWVVDATFKHGVDRHRLDTLVADFKLRNDRHLTLEVWRVKDLPEVDQCVETAKLHLGLPYDISFVPGNDEWYCTELIQDAYTYPDGRRIFSNRGLNFESGSIAERDYWQRLFSRIGAEAPAGVEGTTPRSLMEEGCIYKLDIDPYTYLSK